MSEDFVAAMRRATAAVRGLNVADATGIIQRALGGVVASPGVKEANPARRSLREVVRTLREGRRALGRQGLRRPVQEPPLADGAAFRAERYACAAGARRYRLYVPASAQGAPRGLVVMLHGCTQSPEDFAMGTRMNRVAEAHGLLVAYPEQTRVDNSMACWNWFRPGDQRRDAGEPAILAGIARHIVAAFGVPPGRVFVAGLSAGGAMAAVLGETYPDVFAAVGVHSGLPAGSAGDVVSAFAAMRGDPGLAPPAPRSNAMPRTIVFHGGADRTVHPSNAGQIVAASRRPLRDERGEAGGRGYVRSVAEDADGVPEVECWIVDGAGHAWSGGDAGGSHADPAGPDASAEMVRFFLQGPA
jgi:poly(hydroxyalkanoate) depolymerase family esterase